MGGLFISQFLSYSSVWLVGNGGKVKNIDSIAFFCCCYWFLYFLFFIFGFKPSCFVRLREVEFVCLFVSSSFFFFLCYKHENFKI